MEASGAGYRCSGLYRKLQYSFFPMMAVGMILADINVKDFWDRTVAKFTFHRLVVIPAVVYGVCSFLPLDKNAFWHLCTAGCHAGRRYNKYSGREIWGGFSLCNKKWLFFLLCYRFPQSVCGVWYCNRKTLDRGLIENCN